MARQEQRSTYGQEYAGGYVPIDDIRNKMAYVRGICSVDGVNQEMVRVYHPMSSNGVTQYTSIEWMHPSNGERRLSCNCPAWTIKRKGVPFRTCQHVKDMADDPRLGSPPVVASEPTSTPTPPRRRGRQATTPPPSDPSENMRRFDFGDNG